MATYYLCHILYGILIAKSVLELVYHIGVHIVHSNSTLNRNIFNNWCGKILRF